MCSNSCPPVTENAWEGHNYELTNTTNNCLDHCQIIVRDPTLLFSRNMIKS